MDVQKGIVLWCEWKKVCEDEIAMYNEHSMDDDDDDRACAVENDIGTMKMDGLTTAADTRRKHCADDPRENDEMPVGNESIPTKVVRRNRIKANVTRLSLT